MQKCLYVKNFETIYHKSSEFSDPPGPMYRFCFPDERTVGRTPRVKLMTTYRPGPGGSISLCFDVTISFLQKCHKNCQELRKFY